VYLKPLEKNQSGNSEKHHVDAVFADHGWPNRVNLCIDCEKAESGIIIGVKIIGVDINAIGKTTGDREKFRLKMLELGVGVCKGATATSFLEGKEIAQEIGFPLVIRLLSPWWNGGDL